MNTRKIQPSESLTDKLLHAAEYERGISGHLIRGLVERLPKPDSIWPLDDRAKWLRTAAGNLVARRWGAWRDQYR